MVRTFNALTSLRPFSAAARRAASLLTRVGKSVRVAEPLFEPLEERTLLAADVTATLTVPAFTALSSAGGALSGSIVLRNTGDAAATGFVYRVFISTDTVVGNEDDVELTGVAGLTATLAAGASSTVNLNAFTVPTDVRPGAYFLITQLDTTNVVAEGVAGEANNTVATTSTPIVLNGAATGNPNLTATVTFTARTINPDQAITVPTTVRNTGTAAAGGFHVTWVLSADAVIGNGDDIAIDEEDFAGLAAGATATISRDIQLPVGIALGAYRLGVWVDDRGDVAETNEGDNRVVTPTAALTVALPDISATFTTTGGTISPGGFFTGTLTVRNNTAAMATPFNVYITLSGDNVAGNGDDILLLTVDMTDAANEAVGLAGSAVRTFTNLRVYLPYGLPTGGTLNPGAYRVGVVVDATNEVTEGNEANNTAITATTVVTVPARNTANDPAGADLSAYAYPISGSYMPGQVINVAAVFSNLGNAQATGGVTMAAYLSADNTWDAGDTLMDSDVFDGELGTFNPGSMYGNVALTIPGAAPNGTFYIIFRADEGDTVVETNNGNNSAATGTGTVTRGTVSITAADAAAAETTGTANGGQFRISRTGATTSALTVMYTVTGTAGAGDYNSGAFTGMVTIPAGSASVLLNLTVPDDADAESDETVVLTLNADPFYTLSATQASATVTIADNEPRVSLTTVDGAAGESSGAANMGQLRFTRTGSTTQPMTVLFVVGGTADRTTDFTLTSTVAGANVVWAAGDATGTITIPAGAASVTLNVNVLQDGTAEPSETVLITVGADPAYSVNASNHHGTVTIADDEPTVTIAASDAAAAETTGAANPGQFRVTRTGATTQPLVVHYSVSGTATAGDDYAALTGTVTIPAGALTATFNVDVLQDPTAEGSETVVVTLDPHTTYNLSSTPTQQFATVTIADDEPVVSITAADAAAAESGGVANPGQFRVTRTGATTQPLVVNYTVAGTATNGTDYTNLSGTVTIPAGALSATFNVTVTDDGEAEPSETVVVTLAADTAYNITPTVAQRSATVTIADNEPTVTLSVTDATAAETLPAQAINSGRFTVTRPAGSTGSPLTVHYTVTGTATSGVDYTALPGTVTIPAGATSATFDVVTLQDSSAEPGETVIVTLDADSAYHLPANAAQATGTVTINDDESVVSLTAPDTTAVEGASPANYGTFRISRTGGDQSQQLTVNVVVSGTATNGDWINFVVNTLVIPANQSFYDNPVVPVNDINYEGLENIVITLAPGANYHVTTTAAQQTATVTITDNESLVTVTANDNAAAEVASGAVNNGSFRITRAQGSNSAPLTVFYTLGGTATNGTDYQNLAGSVTIPAGANFVDVPVNVTNDLIAEPGETVVLTITGDATYGLGTAAQQTATVTIADDEPTVTITASDAAAAESGGVLNPGQFRVARTGSTAQPLTVTYTVGGTATPGDDYTALTGTVTIPAGAASATFSVDVQQDALAEPTETVIATLAAGAAYHLGAAAQQTATVNITDNAPTVTVALRDAAGAEVFTGTANPIVYRITRSVVNATPMIVTYVMSGTATGGDDYGMLTGQATIPAGATFVDVTLNVNDDLAVEGSETAIMTLQAGSSYRLGTAAQSTAAATIADNEPAFSVVVTDAAAAETPTGAVNTGSFRISRTGGNGQTSVVNFTMSGSGTPGVDYTVGMTPVAGAVFTFDDITGMGTVTFNGTVTSVTIVVTPTLDQASEAAETAVITLQPASPGDQGYSVSGTQSTAAVTIANAAFADLAAISVGNFSSNSFSRTAANQQVTFDLNIENQGTTTITSVRVTLFLQSAGGVRTNIGTMTFAVNLTPGDSTTLTPTLTLSGFPAVGSYTPGATVAILTGGTDVVTGNNAVTDVGSPIAVTA